MKAIGCSTEVLTPPQGVTSQKSSIGTPESRARTGHGTGELVLVVVFGPRRRTAIVRGRTVASVTRREWNEFAKQTEAK